MITTILRNATCDQLDSARAWVSDQLHIPFERTTDLVAAAYIVKHFEQGSYSGWDGWIEMREADRQ